MRYTILIVAVIFSVLLSFLFFKPQFLETLELKLYDAQYQLRGNATTEPDPNVVVLKIDEASLKEFGQWPWDRRVLAKLLERVRSSGAKVAAFDILFAEPDRLGGDREFAVALRDPNTIIGNYFDKERLVSAVPVLKDTANEAFLNVLPDRDGVVRRYEPVKVIDGKNFPSLALSLASKFLESEPVIRSDATGITSVFLGSKKLPTDRLGRLLINYARAATFKSFSVADVMNGKVLGSEFNNKAVLIGYGAVGLSDMRATPISNAEEGVYIHANAASNIISGKFMARQKDAGLIDIIGLFLIAVISTIIFGRLGAKVSVASAVSIIGILLLLEQAMFRKGIWLPTFYLILATILFFMAITIYRYVVEGRKKRVIHNAFKQYLSPEVIERLLKDPDSLKLGGEERKIAILFSDIRGFTTISEKLEPETLVALLNEYFTLMTDIIMSEGGMVDKYIGDSIMAFFGAPVKTENDSGSAVRAAIKMKETLDLKRPEWIKKFGIDDFRAGIGINTGNAYVGNMGSTKRFSYTATGDAVNVASRLEGLTKQQGTDIIVSESTAQECGETFKFKPLGAVTVKGKSLPVRIFSIN